MTNAGAAQKKWYALRFTVDPAAVEAIEHAFNSLDSLGTEISDMPSDRGETVTVIGYFNELPDEDTLQDEVHYALRVYGLDEEKIRSVEHREVADADWLLEWKKHWKPTEVGRFIIAPPWETVGETGKIVIRIEPNMAFGTGTHETTRLCLRAIESGYSAGDSFLDVGTGTGILAIAAAKVSQLAEAEDESREAGGILACDTDADAVKIAVENAALNGVGEYIQFVTGPLPDDAPVFDVVCANLTADVILPILPLLLDKTRKLLILSGILAEQETSVTERLGALSVTSLRVDHAGEWISITIANPGLSL